MSSVDRGECVTTGGLYRPTPLCVVRLGAGVCVCVCGEGDGPCFRRQSVCMGDVWVSERGGGI